MILKYKKINLNLHNYIHPSDIGQKTPAVRKIKQILIGQNSYIKLNKMISFAQMQILFTILPIM